MPVASGLVGSTTDKRGAVDLVYKESETKYSLIELKVNSNNPLFAAVEILLYGLLFVWSKNNLNVLGYDTRVQPVLAATEVDLFVLAPAQYYAGCNLGNLSHAINDGLDEFDELTELTLTFGFNELSSSQLGMINL